MSKAKCIVYSLGFSFTMITIRQLTSYYFDFIGYYVFTMTLMSVYILVFYKRYKKIGYWGLTCSIIFASAMKYNMLFWTGYIVFVSIFILLMRKKYKKAIKIGLFSSVIAIFSVVVVSYNPFVTNYLDHDNPVYPLYDKYSKVGDDPERSAQPLYILNSPRYKQILYSYTQRPSSDMNSLHYIIPYNITKENIYCSGNPDAKIGGGGFFFIELLLLTFFTFILFRKGDYYIFFLFFVIFLISTLFILPLGTSFRYVPFIYLLPFVALLYTEQNGFPRFAVVVRRLLILFLVLNVSLSSLVALYVQRHNQHQTLNAVKKINNQGLDAFYTNNWGFCNKIFDGDMKGRKPISATHAENGYELNKYIGGPSVYILR